MPSHDAAWRCRRRRPCGSRRPRRRSPASGSGRFSGSLNSNLKSALGQHRRELLHALQRLDPALRLLGLAGLGLEAVDELLQVRDLVLLLREARPAAAPAARRASPRTRCSCRRSAIELGVVDVQRDVGHRVEEFAVVADHDHRAAVALQPGFEPDQRVEVQVVGRLVEQQQVGRAHQRARQLQAHAPAAGEAVDRRVELVGLEAQAQEQRLRARPGVDAAGVADRMVGVRPWRGRRRSASARGQRGLAPRPGAVSPSSTKSVAPSSVSGMSCATSPCASAAASRSRRRLRAGGR